MAQAFNGEASSPPRAILWAVPRSISTAFFRAMMNNKDVKVHLEPYAKAYYFGSERLSERYPDSPIEPNSTFADIKDICEQPESDCKAVFVKDMAYYLASRLNTTEFVPAGYTHTFLIRHPRKTIRSLYKMSLDSTLTGWTYFDPSEVGFEELCQMYDLVKDKLGQEPMVIDADDLVTDPEPILREYCARTGIPYDNAMVNWDQTPPEMKLFQDWLPWFEGTLKSTSFRSPATKKKTDEALPFDLEACIESNMPYYNKLYEKRFTKPSTDNLDIKQ
ncbi:uncharacterized protein LOC141898717 [Tubulanus polymorphus]|uniref:uncharacterized protein LOC141898717 n=1 Tax=Tubulanus polymorphus TaxID=672921 RepID=UPI003DA296A1